MGWHPKTNANAVLSRKKGEVMNFEISFRAIEVTTNDWRKEEDYDVKDSHSIMDSFCIGTELLKSLNLNADDVETSHIQNLDGSISVEIPQKLAIESKRFEKVSTIYVQISREILQEMVFIDVVHGKDAVNLRYAISHENLINLWRESGFKMRILSDSDKEKIEQRKLNRERIEEEKAVKKAEKEAREQEKIDWIKQYGSDYLKDCLEMDVKANLEYVVERAALEFPDYTVDYAETAKWDEKFSPSVEALSELKKIRRIGAETEIIWLTSPAQVREESEYDEYGNRKEYEPCEAVVIRNFLGRYDLVKTF
jgi:hypothetical protein